MKVIIFTKYTRMGASSRLRTFQYIPYYQSHGITCKASPLFNEAYLTRLYAKQRPGKINVLMCYLKRVVSLFTIVGYDVVVVEKELFPYLPATAEKLLKLLGVRFIVDYDDAIFHNYDLHPNRYLKALLKNKIANVMRSAHIVTAGNGYLQNYAQASGARQVVVVPTVVNTAVYAPRNKSAKGPIVIGWVGSPTTVKYLDRLLPVLVKLAEKQTIQLHIIGGKRGIGFKGEKVIEWSEAGEVGLIQRCDIGIMPLEESPWERGKCGYKLIQYMGCGLPVVASPVGVNNQLVQHGINGYKAGDNNSWEMCLGNLIRQPQLRLLMGTAGRQLVEEQYSFCKAAIDWLGILNKTATAHA